MSYAVRFYYNKCCHCEARSAAAIPGSKVRGKYCVLFRGDRHAHARDDTEIQLSLQGSIATAANSREGGKKNVILNGSEESHRKSAEVYALSLKSWDISLTLNMTYFLLPPSGEARFVLLSLRRSVATAAISREGVGLRSMFC